MTERTLPMVESPINPRTCLLGCLAFAGLMVLALGAGSFGLYFVVKGAVQGMTDEAPRPLPTTTLSPEEVADARARVDAFIAGANGSGGPASLTLTADELNGLLHEAGDEGPGAWVYVGIENDQLYGELSLPMRELGTNALGLGERYLNGRVAFDVKVVDGRLSIFMASLEVKDKKVPEDIMARLQAQDLTIHLQGLPQMVSRLGPLDRVEFKDDTVTLVRKRAPLV